MSTEPSLFEQKSTTGVSLTRDEWLRLVFGSEIVFIHRGHEFHFVPEGVNPDPSYIVGKIGRKIVLRENAPPNANFIPIESEHWRASRMILDPSAHEDGQKLAFEIIGAIGAPLPIVKSLANHLNESREHPYIVEANAIIDPQSFWDFEKQNRGQITSITFELIAPNMWGSVDELHKELISVRDTEKAREMIVTLKNEDGLKLDSDSRIEQTLNYAMKGGGSVKARTKNKKKRYDSNNNSKQILVENDNFVEVNPISSIISLSISVLFGNKK